MVSLRLDNRRRHERGFTICGFTTTAIRLAGYPLLTLLGSWWLRLAPEAAGTPASRLSLLCCVMGAGAAVVLGRAAVRVSGGEWEGLLAAATYAFSPLVWRLSTQYEVRSPTPPTAVPNADFYGNRTIFPTQTAPRRQTVSHSEIALGGQSASQSP